MLSVVVEIFIGYSPPLAIRTFQRGAPSVGRERVGLERGRRGADAHQWGGVWPSGTKEKGDGVSGFGG